MEQVKGDELGVERDCASALATASPFFFGEEPVVELALDEVEMSTGGTCDGFGGRSVHGRSRAGFHHRRWFHTPYVSLTRIALSRIFKPLDFGIRRPFLLKS
jgi:hypothetical protein